MAPKRSSKGRVHPYPPVDCIARRTRFQLREQWRTEDPQAEFHPFLRLPLEIRTLIYKMVLFRAPVLARNDIQYIARNDPLYAEEEFPIWESPLPVQEEAGPTADNSIAILRTCREVYEEAKKLPFIYAKWHIWTALSPITRLTKGTEWITSLTIHNAGSEYDDRFSESLNRLLKHFVNLNNIMLRVGSVAIPDDQEPHLRMHGMRMASVVVGHRPNAFMTLALRTQHSVFNTPELQVWALLEHPERYLSPREVRIWKQWYKIMDLMDAKSLKKVFKERRARQQQIGP